MTAPRSIPDARPAPTGCLRIALIALGAGVLSAVASYLLAETILARRIGLR
jgi:hypothetical protein